LPRNRSSGPSRQPSRVVTFNALEGAGTLRGRKPKTWTVRRHPGPWGRVRRRTEAFIQALKVVPRGPRTNFGDFWGPWIYRGDFSRWSLRTSSGIDCGRSFWGHEPLGRARARGAIDKRSLSRIDPLVQAPTAPARLRKAVGAGNGTRARSTADLLGGSRRKAAPSSSRISGRASSPTWAVRHDA